MAKLNKAQTSKATPKTEKIKQKPDLNEFLHQVRLRSYMRYEERMRNGEPGDDMSDWLQAEKEVKEKYGLD